jgi:hypothetical protein
VQNDPESDFEDAAEFFRRGDDGDYAEAESLPAGSIAFAESDDQSNQTDPKLLERQLERRVRYTRRVKLGMGALSLVTVVAVLTRALLPSGDFPSNDDSRASTSDASPLEHASLAPPKELDARSLGLLRATPPAPDLRAPMPSTMPLSASTTNAEGAIIEPATPSKLGPSALAPATATRAAEPLASQPPTVTVVAAPRPTKAAPVGARGARRQALASNPIAKSSSRSSLPSLATIQAPVSQGASRPPTARFAD